MREIAAVDSVGAGVSLIFTLALGLASISCLLQPFIVPGLAKRKGKDAGMWFIVCIIWLFFFSGLALIMMVAGTVAMFAPFAGPRGIAIGAVALVVFVLIANLPLITISMSRMETGLQLFLHRRRFRTAKKRPAPWRSGAGP